MDKVKEMFLQYVRESGEKSDSYACNELGIPDDCKQYLELEDAECTYSIGEKEWETARYTALYINHKGDLEVALFYNYGEEYDDENSEFALLPFEQLSEEEKVRIAFSIAKSICKQ